MSSSPELPGSIPQKPQLWNSAYVRQKQQKKLKPVTYPPDLWLPYNLAINKILALCSPSCPVSTNNQLLRCNPIKSHTWTARLQAGPSREKYNSWSSVLGKDKTKQKHHLGRARKHRIPIQTRYKINPLIYPVNFPHSLVPQLLLCLHHRRESV